jgi:hypothetical protein
MNPAFFEGTAVEAAVRRELRGNGRRRQAA